MRKFLHVLAGIAVAAAIAVTPVAAQRNHDAPFGGFKMSGVGRDGGDFGLLAYSEPQAIIWTS